MPKMSVARNCKQHLVHTNAFQPMILEHHHKSTYMQNSHQLVTFQQRGKRGYSFLQQASQILPAALSKT